MEKGRFCIFDSVYAVIVLVRLLTHDQHTYHNLSEFRQFFHGEKGQVPASAMGILSPGSRCRTCPSALRKEGEIHTGHSNRLDGGFSERGTPQPSNGSYPP